MAALFLGKDHHRLLDRGLRGNKEDVLCHHLRYEDGLRIQIGTHHAKQDVAFREDSYDLAGVDDDDASDPPLVHFSHGFGDCDRRGHSVHI
jgi:hypothetical protein